MTKVAVHVTYGIESSSGAAVLFSHLSALLPTISIVDTHAAAHGWRLPPHDDRCSPALRCCRLRARDNLSATCCQHKRRGRICQEAYRSEQDQAGQRLRSRQQLWNEGRSLAQGTASHCTSVSGAGFSLSLALARPRRHQPPDALSCIFPRASELYARRRLQYAAASSSISGSMQTTRTLSSLQTPVPSMLT